MRLLLVALSLAPVVAQSDGRGDSIQKDLSEVGYADSLNVLEDADTRKNLLDPYPFSNITQPIHEPTVEELMALSPRALFIGRSAMDLTHPRITTKVDNTEIGRGHIEGQPELCDYLLDASVGTLHQSDVSGVRMYDVIARLECSWAPCRLCQHRMMHVFGYCMARGKEDPGLRGVCEHSDPDIQQKRLTQMVFDEGEDGANLCRTWRDTMINERYNDGQAAFFQGAHTAGDACGGFAKNPEMMLQKRKNGMNDFVAAHCHYSSAKLCKHGAYMLPVTPGIEPAEDFDTLVGQDEPDTEMDPFSDSSLLSK